MRFRVSFYNKQGELVDDPKAISDRYFKSFYFALDFAAALPLDIFAFAAPAGNENNR